MTALLVVACGLALVPYRPPSSIGSPSVLRRAFPGPRVVRGGAHDGVDPRHSPRRRLDPARGGGVRRSGRAGVDAAPLATARPPAPLRRELLALLALVRDRRLRARLVLGHRLPVPGAGDRLGPLPPLRGRGRHAGRSPDRRSTRRASPTGSSPTRPLSERVYGSLLLLDGVSSWSLTAGLVVLAGPDRPERVRGGSGAVGHRRRPRRRRRIRRRPDPARPCVLARARDSRRNALPAPRAALARAALPRRTRPPCCPPASQSPCSASRPRTLRARSSSACWSSSRRCSTWWSG